jgi:hypothetical protein
MTPFHQRRRDVFNAYTTSLDQNLSHVYDSSTIMAAIRGATRASHNSGMRLLNTAEKFTSLLIIIEMSLKPNPINNSVTINTLGQVRICKIYDM